MASLPPQIATASFSSSFSTNPSTLLCPPAFVAANNRTRHGLKASCKATNNGDNHQQQDIPKNASTSQGKFDRRDVLVGLGGLYGATTLGVASEPLAQATPVAVNFVDCVLATKPDEQRIKCCPPGKVRPADVKDYQVPALPESQIRTRPAAHLVDDEYLSKYTQAIKKMMNLPADDPRNFYQQANVHCAFCDAAYTQVGYPNLPFEVHFCWIFLPWHRWYLYFFERICQEMIQDPTFSLPYWNWDAPDGMKIPSIFDNPNSVLWDVNRNPNHRPPVVVDLLFNQQESGLSPHQQIATNLTTMYRKMICVAKGPRQFFGEPYRAGSDANPGAGTLETAPHNTVHQWTGSVPGGTKNPLGEDMGVLYSAARDPIFYSHHSNVDRMWHIWLGLGPTHRNLRCRDWLKASFVFYDEKAQPVRVTVEQALDTKKLGYVYQELPLPWLGAKPTPRRSKAKLPTAPEPSEVFPTALDKVINVLVHRPKQSRSKKDKDAEEEILVIDGIEFNIKDELRFDVFINEEDVTAATPANTEFVGIFTNVRHSHGMKVKSCLRLGITEVVDELGADDFDKLLVTLVPRTGTATIGKVFIEFDSDPDEF